MNKNRTPRIDANPVVYIVCEGSEEYDYLTKLKECNVWSNNYTVKLKNAKSIDRIYGVYEYWYSQAGKNNIVLIFCDTEAPPYEKINLLKKKIKELHNRKASETIIFFANPCTLQIILSHFKAVQLTSNKKSDNSSLVKECTGVSSYDATEHQRDVIMAKINAENYKTMKDNIAKLSSEQTKIPSTNFLELLSFLENDDTTWIRELNKKIESA